MSPTCRVDPIGDLSLALDTEARDRADELPAFLDRADSDGRIGTDALVVNVESRSTGWILSGERSHLGGAGIAFPSKEVVEVGVAKRSEADRHA